MKVLYIYFLLFFFMSNSVSAQKNITVKIHNDNGSAVVGRVVVFFAKDQGENKKGDVYIPGTGDIASGKTHVLTLPNKKFVVSVGIIGFAIVAITLRCSYFIPTNDNSIITISIGGEWFGHVSGIGVQDYGSTTYGDRTSCRFPSML